MELAEKDPLPVCERTEDGPGTEPEHNAGPGSVSGRRRPKRIITPARKEQNKLAQRLYRQRQKVRQRAAQDRIDKGSGKYRELQPRLDLEIRSSDINPPVPAKKDQPAVNNLDDGASTSLIDPGLSGLASGSSSHDGSWPRSSTNLTNSPPIASGNDHVRVPLRSSASIYPPDFDMVPSGRPSSTNTVADSAPLPDPHMNNLQLTRTTSFNAFMNNAICLNFSIRDLIGDSCQGYLSQSPLFRPTTPQDDPKALLAAAAPPTVPENLRPTLPQILIPHHPYLDLLPFPEMRARAIILAATMPAAFNIFDLKADVYLHEGMVCWAGGRGGGTGQPWDMRSWEVAPWFLHKWRLLVDGEGGDMWSTSAWWQSIRSSGESLSFS